MPNQCWSVLQIASALVKLCGTIKLTGNSTEYDCSNTSSLPVNKCGITLLSQEHWYTDSSRHRRTHPFIVLIFFLYFSIRESPMQLWRRGFRGHSWRDCVGAGRSPSPRGWCALSTNVPQAIPSSCARWWRTGSPRDGSVRKVDTGPYAQHSQHCKRVCPRACGRCLLYSLTASAQRNSRC